MQISLVFIFNEGNSKNDKVSMSMSIDKLMLRSTYNNSKDSLQTLSSIVCMLVSKI